LTVNYQNAEKFLQFKHAQNYTETNVLESQHQMQVTIRHKGSAIESINQQRHF